MKSNEIQEIKRLVAKWKDKKGSLIMILHEIQDHYGYVPEEVSKLLSDMLDIPLARIYEVITFYHYFSLEPPGKHKISICMGTACYLKGAPKIIDEIKELLDIEEGGITKDGLFQLELVRCLGCCGLAPVISIDGKIYGNVKAKEVSKILANYTMERTA